MIADAVRSSGWTILLVLVPVLYYIYYRKFRCFVYDQPEKVTKGKIVRGKCPPSYPNGRILVRFDHPSRCFAKDGSG